MKYVVTLVLAFWFSSDLVHASDRPTAEEVAKSVTKSRREYASQYPTLKSIQDLQKELDEKRGEWSKSILSLPSDERKVARQKPTPEIDELKKNIADSKKQLSTGKRDEYFIISTSSSAEFKDELESLVGSPQLSRLNWSNIEIGSVGWVGELDWGGLRTGGMKCLQRLPDGRWLGQQVLHSDSGIATVAGRTTEMPLVLVSGIKKDVEGKTIMDGGHYSLFFNAVVVGEYSYKTALGTSKTVFIIEKFDPNIKFE